MAGLIGLRISIHDTQNGTVKMPLTKTIWDQRLKKRPGNIKARAYIYQCRDLPAADEGGSSDPFVVVHDSDREQRTQTIEDNLNPIFYQALELMYEANEVAELPPFIIDCYDEDVSLLGGKPSADFLSRAVIPIKDLKYSTDNKILTPKWYPLRLTSSSPVAGEVLVSFAIVEDDFQFSRELKNVRLEDDVQM